MYIHIYINTCSSLIIGAKNESPKCLQLSMIQSTRYPILSGTKLELGPHTLLEASPWGVQVIRLVCIEWLPGLHYERLVGCLFIFSPMHCALSPHTHLPNVVLHIPSTPQSSMNKRPQTHVVFALHRKRASSKRLELTRISTVTLALGVECECIAFLDVRCNVIHHFGLAFLVHREVSTLCAFEEDREVATSSRRGRVSRQD